MAARTLRVTFATVFVILAAVFVVLTLDLRARVRTEVADNLETGGQVVSELERRHMAELEVHLGALTRNPTLEAAVLKYRNLMGSFSALEIRQSMEWLERTLEPIAVALDADIAAALDERNLTMARAGRLAAEWPRQLPPGSPEIRLLDQRTVLRLRSFYFQARCVPLVTSGERVGRLCLATQLNGRYASRISALTRAKTAIVVSGVVIASTFTGASDRALRASWRGAIPERGEVTVGRETYAFRRLDRAGEAGVYGLAPLTTPASRTTAKAYRALMLVAVGSLGLAALGSLLLARRLSSPIDEISRSLSAAVAAGDLGVRLRPDGSSREVDLLKETFNDLMASLSRAERETQGAYAGAIRALAIALEARDRHTAGHSERVSDLSSRIGRRLGMADEAIEVLRLGAALHDIGKIGVSDLVLHKRGPLTEAERRAIRIHPALGARILQPVAFLAAHLPIVEQHHEQPDGHGYPHGLQGHQICVSASIVRLADAFDAMTSERPYRPARSPREAIDEIVRNRGSQFDAAVVDAFLAVAQEAGRGPLDRSNAAGVAPSGGPGGERPPLAPVTTDRSCGTAVGRAFSAGATDRPAR